MHKHARLRSTISLCCYQNRLTDMLNSMAEALLWTGWLSNFAVLIRTLTDLTQQGVPKLTSGWESARQHLSKLRGLSVGNPCSTLLTFPPFLPAETWGPFCPSLYEGVNCPTVYFRRKMSDQETRYSTVEKPCLAIRWAFDSLCSYFLGCPFTLC